VREVELAGPAADEVTRARPIGHRGPIEDEAERERGLVVLADADGPGQLGQPLFETPRRLRLQRRQGRGPRARLAVVPIAELGRELEEPGQAVGALERRAALALDVG